MKKLILPTGLLLMTALTCWLVFSSYRVAAESDAKGGATTGEISPLAEPRAKIAAGANANARLSLDLIANGGSGNQQNDDVPVGTVSGRGTKIAIEVFATGVTTSLIGMQLRFDFDASLVTFVKAENSAFAFDLPQPKGTDFAATSPVTLPSSGFLTRAEFTTTTDVTGRKFSIGIASVMLSESQSSSDTLTTTNRISFNVPTTPTPDFDGDGMVGFSDFLAFAGRYGTRRGDGRYQVRYDLNGDGRIGFSDFLSFASSYGKRVSSSPVVISDANLRAVIENILGKVRGAPIIPTDMETLRRIEARNAGINDLTGLEFATGLTWLNLGGNTISDLSPLSGLTNLTGLELENNVISDLSALSGLTRLEWLWLSNTTISDLSALSGLTNLTGLFLFNNAISDLSPLVTNRGLDNGDQVGVQGNPLSAISINTHIPALQSRGVTVISGDDTPKMYWTDWSTNKIQRANLDGSNVEDLITTGLSAPEGIALDLVRGKMYWADWGYGANKIQRANLDGSNVEDLITTGLRGPEDIALDLERGKMYWTDSDTDKIQRANLDGSQVEDLITGVIALDGIALDLVRGKIYWTDWSTRKIQRANLDGSNVEDFITTRVRAPDGIALDLVRGKIYWTDWTKEGPDKIQRANLDGSQAEDLITTGLSEPRGIALDLVRGKMYWTDSGTEKIQRANLDGSQVEDLITTGLSRPFGIALDTSGGW